MLLSEGILKYEEYVKFRNLSKNTINAYKKEIRYLLEYLIVERNFSTIYINEISLKDLEGYIKSKKERGNILSSINRSISIIKVFFTFLNNREIIKVNPSINIETYRIINKAEREVLTEQEIKTLIEKIDNPTVKHAVKTMANTGMSISELTNLKLTDVNFENRIIKIINGKGGKNRIIPMNNSLYRSLRKYKEEIRPKVDSDYFFATEMGHRDRIFVPLLIHKIGNF